MQAAQEAQILCRPQAIRVMTLSGSKRIAGKSSSLPLLLRDHKEFARKLGRSFCDPLPLPLDNHHSVSAHIHHRAGNTIIRLSSPHHHLLPLVSSLIRVPVFVFRSQLLIIRPYHQIRPANSSRDRIQSTSRLPRLPSHLHHDFTIISNAISTWPSISTGRR